MLPFLSDQSQSVQLHMKQHIKSNSIYTRATHLCIVKVIITHIIDRRHMHNPKYRKTTTIYFWLLYTLVHFMTNVESVIRIVGSGKPRILFLFSYLAFQLKRLLHIVLLCSQSLSRKSKITKNMRFQKYLSSGHMYK